MRVDTPTVKTARLLLAATLGLAMTTGCHNAASNDSTSQGSSGDSKTNGGNGETSGNNAKGSGNGATKNAQTQGGSPAGELTEPATSTTGSATGPEAAASDRGSPAATAHQSVAMPGAPEPTIKDKQPPPPKGSQTSAPR